MQRVNKSNVKKRRVVSRRKNKGMSHAASKKLIGGIIVVFVLFIGTACLTLMSENATKREQEAELMQKLKEEQQRVEEISAYKEYTNTDEYVEKVAKEKLGLVYPQEIILKPEM